MALVANAFGNKPGFGGRHSVTFPIGTTAGVYEIPVSPGKKTIINVGNAAAQPFEHITYLFTPEEATKLEITRVKGVIASAIVDTSYIKSALAGVRTVGIEFLLTSVGAVTVEVLESKG